MSPNELLRQAQFLVDANGQRMAVVLDIGVWQQLLYDLGFGVNGAHPKVEPETLDPAKNPLLGFIGAVSVDGLGGDIDKALYGK